MKRNQKVNKNILFLFFFLQFFLINEKLFSQNRRVDCLKVTEIKKNKDWFIIYANNTNENYKLLTKNIQVINKLDTFELKENNYYSFLIRKLTNEFYFHGIKQILIPSDCFSIDVDVDICVELKNRIYEVFFIKEVFE